MAQACEGIKVLDFSQGMAGAIATMFLCDNGAEVIKVEPPAGDRDRARPAFLQWARGKKSVVLDLKTSEGVDTAHRLARGADAVLESFRPGVADRMGIGYETLRKLNESVVYCSITGFGPKGAYRNIKGYDAVVAAKTGRMVGQNCWKRPGPMFDAIPRMSYGAAHLAVQGILAALWAREKTGKGQLVQTSLVQAATVHSLGQWQVMAGTEEQRIKEFETPRPPGTPQDSMPAGYIIVECKDGRWIQMASTTVHIFRNFVNLLGLERIYEDARFRDIPYTFPSPEEMAKFLDAIRAKMIQKTSGEWTELFLKDGNIGGERYETTEEFMRHPQALHNGLVIEVDDPRVGKMKQIGHLATFRETPSRIQGPAPDQGQHTQEVGAELARGGTGWSSPAFAASPNGRINTPLEGVTVLELASYYAAPFGATLLAEMGARVIKIEPPSGDLMRRIPEVFPKTMQGKESIAIDLKTAEGRAVFHRLVERADALMHNFRPGSWERIGLDYDTIRAVNPRLLYLYAGSYGSTGPYSRQPAFHPTLSAITGSGIRMSGKGNPPMDSGQGDPDASLGVATGLMMGLRAGQRTGKGQYMETRMITTGSFDVSDEFLDYAGKPAERLPDAEQHGFHALYRLYDTGRGWLFLACPSDEEWRALCRALERDDLLEDVRFSTGESRLEHDAELIEALETALRERSADEFEKLLLDRDVAAVRADGPSWPTFFLTDPSIGENGLRATTTHPHFGDYHRHGPTVTFSELQTVHGPPAVIGQHTRPIMQELGYDDGEIRALEEQGVVVHDGPWSGGAG